ncbi:MAG TPA: LuxR C-terminal-related transcriptional regulator [Dermatophilaceae bacterium]|nr:LuxR C-terminal-related transcriptional regulator [Dermatophilaceae bacterium]
MPNWPAEYAALAAAEADNGLSPEDLERLSVAAFMVGRDEEVVLLRERAHREYLSLGRPEQAAWCAFWASFHLQNRGEHAQAAGWAARLRRAVEDGGDPDGRLARLLHVRDSVALMFAGRAAEALPVLESLAAQAARCLEMDASVLAGLARARCLEMLGRRAEAVVAIDEAMVQVVGGRAAPEVTGLAYCVAVDLCMGWYDLGRADEWTNALAAWVNEQAGMVPYRGVCLVHRADLSYLHGRWTQATQEAQEACQRLLISREPAVGGAHYRLGEVARLRGRLAAAERAYAKAAQAGQEVQPGLALLRLAQGRADAAAAGLDRALVERGQHPELLAARVEVALSCGDRPTARSALEALAQALPQECPAFLLALRTRCQGALLLAEGDAAAALPVLRRSWTLWHKVDAPYEAARTRLLVAQACQRLGDGDAAAMELAAACGVLTELDARPELDRLGIGARGHGDPDQLSPREREVLALVATGASNRAIAARLVLSEKTVARHLSNIFDKTGVASRSAATAYAYDHGLT